MTVLVILCLLLTATYLVLILAYMWGWQHQQEFTTPVNYEPTTFISVIIPARNEEGNIGACIDALLDQRYHRHIFEVIVVDDHSTDRTAEVVKEYADERVKYISLAEYIEQEGWMNSYKKAALAAGIAQSGGELIVTTDADCIAPNAWLRHIACMYETQTPAMIVAPVIYQDTNGLTGIFQLIDFMGMQGITAATHRLKLGNMSNGANLAFTREIFYEVNGYQGIEHLASGDDYLLMMKIAKKPGSKIAYLKSKHAIVTTLPQPDWQSFFRQRIRWASKSGKYNDVRMTLVLAMVYLYHLCFPVLAVGGFWHSSLWWLALAMLGSKIIAEYLFMRPVTAFFNKKWARPYLPFVHPLHIVYIIVAGFLGMVGKYEWKGRKVK